MFLCNSFQGIGKKSAFLLNLPEVYSTHTYLGADTVSARFCTAPFLWNVMMEVMAKVLGK